MNTLFQDKLVFSTKEKKALDALGVTTIDEFMNFDMERVRALQGYGQTTIDKLCKKRRKFESRQIRNPKEKIYVQKRIESEYDNLIPLALNTTITSPPWRFSFFGASDSFNHLSRILKAISGFPKV